MTDNCPLLYFVLESAIKHKNEDHFKKLFVVCTILNKMQSNALAFPPQIHHPPQIAHSPPNNETGSRPQQVQNNNNKPPTQASTPSNKRNTSEKRSGINGDERKEEIKYVGNTPKNHAYKVSIKRSMNIRYPKSVKIDTITKLMSAITEGIYIYIYIF